MMIEAATNFVGEGPGMTDTCAATKKVMAHLERLFLSPSHQIMRDLETRFIQQCIRGTVKLRYSPEVQYSSSLT